MHKHIALLAAGALALSATGRAGVQLVAGWDFGQFVLPGSSATDPASLAPSASIPANHSESAGFSAVSQRRGGQPASAGVATLSWPGFANTAFDGEIQAAAPGAASANATTAGNGLIGVATFGRLLGNLDSDPQGLALLADAEGTKDLEIRVDLADFGDFNPAANDGLPNLSVAAASDTGATIQWIVDDAVVGTSDVPATSLAGFAAYEVDLPAALYGRSEALIVARVSGRVALDNLQINGVPTTNPVFTLQPQSQVVALGGTASFTVETDFGDPISYRWQFEETDLVDGGNISGATTPTLTVTGVTEDDVGRYRVIVTFAAFELTSNFARLDLPAAPAFDVQPSASPSATRFLGQSVTLSATVSGLPVPALEWRKDGEPVTNGGRISGADTASLTINDLGFDDAGAYTLVAVNSVDVAESDPVNLVVQQPLVIQTPPVSQTVAPGSNVTFSVTALGQGDLGYQWFKGTQEIEGAIAATLQLTDVGPDDAGFYSVRVTDANGDLASSAARLIVGFNVPVNARVTQTFVPGVGLVLTANVAPPAGGSYQWLRSGKIIPGATGETLVIPGATIADSGTYSVRLLRENGRTASTRVIARVLVTPAATYDAIIRAEGGAEPIGRVQFVINKLGRFTGQLRYEDGRSYALRGALGFDDNGYEAGFDGTINRGRTVSALAYRVELDAQAKELVFTLRDGETTLGSAAGELRIGTKVLPAWSGAYALALAPLPTELENQPEATATLKATVARRGGTMRVTGRLADNTRITSAAPASVDGVYAHWLALYSRKGHVGGELRLVEADGAYSADLESSGPWVWVRPVNPRSKVFPGGVDLLLSPELTRP
jgi:hypothetical protein